MASDRASSRATSAPNGSREEQRLRGCCETRSLPSKRTIATIRGVSRLELKRGGAACDEAWLQSPAGRCRGGVGKLKRSIEDASYLRHSRAQARYDVRYRLALGMTIGVWCGLLVVRLAGTKRRMRRVAGGRRCECGRNPATCAYSPHRSLPERSLRGAVIPMIARWCRRLRRGWREALRRQLHHGLYPPSSGDGVAKIRGAACRLVGIRSLRDAPPLTRWRAASSDAGP